MTRALVFGSIGAIVFAFGVAVGHYQLPPFAMMQSVKQQFRINEAFDSWFPRFRSHEARVDIVMLGDSITAGTDWTALSSQVTILNLGIVGDTSAGVLNRLGDVIGRQPRAVFVMIGVNDFFADFPVDLVKGNIQFVAMKLINNGIQPIIQSTLYVSDDVRPELNARIRSLNTSLRDWCANHSIQFVDLNGSLAVDGSLAQKFSDDGVHLNKAGYAVWKRVIVNYVRQPSLQRSIDQSPPPP